MSPKWFLVFRLDDATFRRNNKGESQSFSVHKPLHQMSTIAKTYQSVSSIHSQNENDKLNQTEFHCGKYKSIKSEKSVDQISTVFGERLHKKIIKEEKEREETKVILKLNPEINIKENIMESDKENGSQPNRNNGNESNVALKNPSSGKDNYIFIQLYTVLYTILHITKKFIQNSYYLI